MTSMFKKTCAALCRKLKVFFTKYRSHSAPEEVVWLHLFNAFNKRSLSKINKGVIMDYFLLINVR